MVVTPIIYASEAVPRWIHWLNPTAGMLMVARDSLIQGTITHWEMAAVYGLIAVPLLILGLIVYRVSLPILVERMPG
jgi:lipopolysaccharide transport system permease protein